MRVNPQHEQWVACRSTKRAFVASCLLLVGAVLPVGCNQSPSEEELGDIHYSLPNIPGAEKPHKLLPPLTRKPKEKTDAAETTAEVDSAIPAEDPPAENLEQKPAESENALQENSPAAEMD